jgi:hypothetical protein
MDTIEPRWTVRKAAERQIAAFGWVVKHEFPGIFGVQHPPAGLLTSSTGGSLRRARSLPPPRMQ